MARDIPLLTRDEEIIRHVRRFGMTTAAILHKLFFDNLSRKAVERVTTRLISQGQLVSYPLYHPVCYYRLARPAARRLGLDEEDSKPYGGQAILRAYGTLAFCCLGAQVRQKITSEEFRQKFPDCVTRQIPAYAYYFDNDGETIRVGLVLVDHGADYRRIVRKTQRAVRQRLSLPAFRNLIRLRRFVIAVVTASEDKAAMIKTALTEIRGDVRYRVDVVPELVHLIGVPRDPARHN